MQNGWNDANLLINRSLKNASCFKNMSVFTSFFVHCVNSRKKATKLMSKTISKSRKILKNKIEKKIENLGKKLKSLGEKN